MAKTAMTLVAAVLLAGCAGMREAPGAFPGNHAQLFDRYLKAVLKDPSAARVRHVAGPAMLAPQAADANPAPMGWGVCYLVDAKNDYGARVGSRRFVMFVRGDRVVDVQRELQTRGSAEHDARVARLCHSLRARAGQRAQA